jgi:cytoskeletal protein CcmA (bactofilin family)
MFSSAKEAVSSIISSGLKVTGDLKSDGDLQIDGIVDGDIDSRMLIVGESAEVNGTITAEAVRISGRVEGQVKAKNVTLDKTAKVIGDIAHESLAMEAGAHLEGHLSRAEDLPAGKGSKGVSPSGP